MRRRVLVAALLVSIGAAYGAVGARGDGLPVLGVDVGGTGVTTAGGADRYVTMTAGRGTVVARIQVRGGQVATSRLLKGAFTIPAVAYDGSASGLSADGRTLVLIEPRASFPRSETTLVALGADTLRIRRVIRLRGDFGFDAISPGGRVLYVIQYYNPSDPSAYRVRALDLRDGRLLAKPIVDPTSPKEQMRGYPLSRATSPNGRWAYTLYNGSGGMPFVHMLDTSGLTARCVDLDGLGGADLSRARLVVQRNGGSVAVMRGHHRLAVVDARTFRVGPSGSGGVAWVAAAVAAGTVATLLAFAVLLQIRLRRRREPALVH